MDTTMPISEAKAKLASLVREAEENDVTLLRHGRPAAVLISPQRLEALIARLEDAEDRLAVHEAPGVTMDYDKLAAELGLDDD